MEHNYAAITAVAFLKNSHLMPRNYSLLLRTEFLFNVFQFCYDKRFLEYCDDNSASIAVERKDTVENIVNTLRKLDLCSVSSSGNKVVRLI